MEYLDSVKSQKSCMLLQQSIRSKLEGAKLWKLRCVQRKPASRLVTAVQNGERVVIMKRDEPVVEIVRYRGRGGIDFDKLAAARELVGLAGDGERWPQEFNDPAFSRRLLGFDG